MWGSVLEILKKKAAAGVEVRFMYDGMCSISAASARLSEKNPSVRDSV